jgi:serine/threonine protein phosphatase PrpC
MTSQLTVSTGQHTDKGAKPVNQDFHGLVIPDSPQSGIKGIAVAIADGISSSNVSQIASESAVAGFLNDYYATPNSWSVKQSAQRVLRATNAWLHAQTRQSRYRYDQDRGYVCTLSVLVLQSATAHLFHVGDARIYRLQGNSLEQLTTDHRVWLSREDSCLNRAMGLSQQVDIDYLAAGDDLDHPALSEFLFDLRQPNPQWQRHHQKPLMERHPVAFWQGMSALLLLALLASFAWHP